MASLISASARVRRFAAATMLAVFAVLLAGVFAGASTSPALAADSGQTGSITVHKLSSAQSGAPGTGAADDVLPSDAVPIPGVGLRLEMLSDDPTAADGENPQITVESPALPEFGAQEVATDERGVAVWDGLARGVYRVTETDSAGFDPAQRSFLVAVPRAASEPDGQPNWDVHVFPKSMRASLVTKTPAEGQSAVVGVGDVVRWTIDNRIPDGLKSTAGGVTTYGKNWTAYDDLDSRLDWGGVERMRLFAADGSEIALRLEAGASYQETYDADSHRVTWSFTQDALQAVADSGAARLVIDVRTVVNERAYADADPLKNDAGIRFVNASGDPVEGDTGQGGTAQVATGGIVVDKFLQSDGRKLAGAEFKLSRSFEDAQAGRYVCYADGSPVVLVTDGNGAAQAGGLAPGEWWITETKAPVLADGTACVRLEGSERVIVGDAAESAVTQVQVANRVEGSLGGGSSNQFPITSDAMMAIALAALMLGVAALIVAVVLRRTRHENR